jgi:hypothetical protein
MGTLYLKHGLRAVSGGDRARASRSALRVLLGLQPPPFGQPPHAAVSTERPLETTGSLSS